MSVRYDGIHTFEDESSFHPQSNALCERWNQNIIQALRLYCTDQEKWLDYIPPLLYSYRATSAMKTIKTSPFEALFGQKMKLPIDLSLIPTEEFHDDVQKYVQDMVPKLALTEKIILENTRESQEKNNAIYDRQAASPKYKVGDEVWLKNCTRKVRQNAKLMRPYQGPYLIEQAGQKNFWFEVEALRDR